MEENNLATHSAAPQTARNRTLAGVFVLGLLFLASTTATLAYLNAPAPQEPQQQQQAAAASVKDTFAGISLEAHAAYVYDIARGKTLYALNPDVQLPLASLTKVPMALTVSEVLDPNAVMTIPYDTAPPGALQRLGKGERWGVRSVLDFTLVSSSNQGAEILAAEANDAIRAKYPQAPADATLWRMNQLAQDLGLTRTYFLNVSGLDESTTQSGAYGSARDMAALFAYAARTAPQVFQATAHDDLTLTAESGHVTPVINTDKAINAIPGLIMGKTGFTDLAGGNLVVVFNAGLSHPVVAVVLGSTEQGRFEDMKKLVSASIEAVLPQQ